jgi:ribosome-binding factor A
MRSTRLRRIDDQMMRVLGEALLMRVQDPRIGFVSVTGVRVSKEFDTAKVWVSVLGDAEDREKTLKGLRSAAPFLQSEIAKAMRLRRIPKLRFLYDDSLERGLRIDATLRDLDVPAEELPEQEPGAGGGADGEAIDAGSREDEDDA